MMVVLARARDNITVGKLAYSFSERDNTPKKDASFR